MSVFDLKKTANDHMIIVAHRGVSGGNIPCNTAVAYEIALMQGADMIETDVSMTKDGVLCIFHPRMERSHLAKDIRIDEMTWDEVKELRFVNYDRTVTQFGLMTFDELLDRFKGRCYINVDKFWDHPKEIYEAIKAHDMIDQVVVKSSLSDEVLSVLREVAPELPFMPIVKNTHPKHKELMESGINYIGAEVLFDRDDAEVASDEFINMMHRDGKLVWVNSIIYSYKAQLSGRHSDDTALSESMDKGWGWLADKKFDLIQTDWPLMLREYLVSTDKYCKNK